MIWKKMFGIFTTTITIALLFTFFRRDKNKKIRIKRHQIISGMREIENPFVEEEVKPEDTQQSVVVKNIDYKKKDVYKHDILLITGTIVVIASVIILSIVSFNRRQQQDNSIEFQNKKKDSILIHTLINMKDNLKTLSVKIDSMDLHMKQEISSLNNVAITLKKAQQKGGKK